MEAGFGRAAGGIKGEEMKSRLLQPLGWRWQLLIHQAARRGARLNGRTARRRFIELMPVAAAGHKEEPLAHAEPRPPLTLEPRDSKAHPHQRQPCIGQGTMTIPWLLRARSSMRCKHAPAILPLTWHGELGSWEGQGGPGALQGPAAQPAMAEMLTAPAGTSRLGFHLPSQMGWYKISSQSLEDSPAAPSQAELRKRERCQSVS